MSAEWRRRDNAEFKSETVAACLQLGISIAQTRRGELITEVHSVPIEKYGPWDHHESEDFLYVLDGVIEVHLGGHPSVQLRKGDSIQMDGRIPHALIAVPVGDSKARKPLAQLLWISVPFA